MQFYIQCEHSEDIFQLAEYLKRTHKTVSLVQLQDSSYRLTLADPIKYGRHKVMISNKDKRIIIKRLNKKDPVTDIAKDMNLSRSQIYKLKKECLK